MSPACCLISPQPIANGCHSAQQTLADNVTVANSPMTAQVLDGQCQALQHKVAPAGQMVRGQGQQATPGQLRRVRESMAAHVQAVCSAQQRLNGMDAALASAETY